MTTTLTNELDTTLNVGGRALASRLIVGTGKYQTYELMQQSLDDAFSDRLSRQDTAKKASRNSLSQV